MINSHESLKKALISAGCSTQQVNSVTVSVLADLIDRGEVDGMESPRDLIKKLELLMERVTEVTIDDRQARDGVNVYTEILSRTKAIVGDDLTEQIWVKTIEAASYGMWRSIMGPKFEERENGRRRL